MKNQSVQIQHHSAPRKPVAGNRKRRRKSSADSNCMVPTETKHPDIRGRKKRIFGDMRLSDEQSEQLFKAVRGE